jgi:serine phosphatase RsbU (regulator of sigma subunit)
MKLKFFILFFLLSVFCGVSSAQIKQIGSPYIKNYTSKDFPANNQNWSIINDTSGVMYFGNTNGILEFDGIKWNLVKTPKKSAVRALDIDIKTNTVYVGAANDFGYLKRDQNGSIDYISLIDSTFKNYNPNISSVTVSEKEGVIFESPEVLYVLKNDTVKEITLSKTQTDKIKKGTKFKGVFKAGDGVFVVHTGIGIMTLKKGVLKESFTLEEAGTDVYSVIQVADSFVIVNREEGIFTSKRGICKKFNTPLNSLIQKDVYTVLRLHDGSFAFGTFSKGIIITDKYLNVVKTGLLTGKQIYALFEDGCNILWAAGNSGISLLDLYSPFSRFDNSVTGITGTIRSAIEQDGKLYVGTDAVYVCPLDSLDSPKFKELKNPNGRSAVWKLDTVNGKILGGTNTGLISISGQKLTPVDKDRNIFNFTSPKNNPGLLVAVGGNGFSVYENKNGSWAYRNGAEGFNFKVRNIETDKNGNFWVSEKSNGVYKINFNEDYNYAREVNNYGVEKGLPSGLGNYLFNTGRELVLGTTDGFYKYIPDSDKFFPHGSLNAAFGGKGGYEMMYVDEKDNIWIKRVIASRKDPTLQHWLLERYTMTGDSAANCLAGPFLPYMDKIYCITSAGNGCYIIGNQDGFIHYDEKVKKDFYAPYKALIRGIENVYNDSVIVGAGFTGKQISIPYSFRSIRIEFSAASYEYPEFLRFKTFLEHNDDAWSDFKSETKKEYSNLWPGTYKFHVIAKNAFGVESREAVLTIKILAPWYLTIWALIFYVLLLAAVVWLIIKAYTQKLVRDNHKLEEIVEQRTSEIRKQSKLIMEKNEEITEKNKSITDSIEYALHIQQAMLPLKEKIDNALPVNFILYRPKDIVSGDYYWFAETDKKIIITAADCTGHGVPGAFMSMIGSQILTEIVSDGITSADEILTNQNFRIRKALKQDTTENHDGMDMALCSIDKETHLVEYSGAKNPLIYIQNEEITTIKADKQGIGGDQIKEDFHYTKHEVQPDGNTWFYMFSDGYEDQFGGPEGKKFKIKNLRELIFKIHNEPPEKQREILNQTIEDWIGQDGEQTDDIILMGFKL